MSDDDEEGRFIARSTDPGTSWAAASMASKGKLNALYLQQLREAGREGKTTMAMSKDTGRPRDSFSPRYTQLRSLVDAIGVRREPNENGKLSRFTVYRLKEFRPDPDTLQTALLLDEPPKQLELPLLLGWQVKKDKHPNG